MSLSEAFISEINQEAKATRRLLEVVPEDKLGWKPHDKSMTLARLAGHVAENAGWAETMMASEVLDFATMDHVPFEPKTKAELLATFDEALASCGKALQGKSDEELAVVWTMRNGETVLGAMPRHVAIRTWVLSHNVHHRGQLTVYLRLLDVPLPGIYGPSADDASF
jgi:uncharacterized damage-inducible protein DinB